MYIIVGIQAIVTIVCVVDDRISFLAWRRYRMTNLGNSM